jgi:hypothetical protein
MRRSFIDLNDQRIDHICTLLKENHFLAPLHEQAAHLANEKLKLSAEETEAFAQKAIREAIRLVMQADEIVKGQTFNINRYTPEQLSDLSQKALPKAVKICHNPQPTLYDRLNKESGRNRDN